MSNQHASATGKIPFSKMNGLGNDFIVIDARERDISLTAKQVRILAERTHPITKGCDQLLIIRPAYHNGDAFMQIFNADGREVEACGNGARAVAAYLVRETTGTQWHQRSIETQGGLLACRVSADDMTQVSITMPLPQFGTLVSLHADLPDAMAVNVGNPHAVMFVGGGTAGLAAQYGPQLEGHAVFADRANINFASLVAPQTLRLDTWERGAGLTKSCGTGACATAAAAIHQGLCAAGAVSVRPPSNHDDNAHDVLVIDYQPDKHLVMTGPVQFDFNGEIAWTAR